MKWQNLMKKKCPKCEAELRPVNDKTILYACTGCEFIITRRKYAEILADPNHIMRSFLTTEELYQLEEAIQKSYA
jgi:hypothetical protein